MSGEDKVQIALGLKFKCDICNKVELLEFYTGKYRGFCVCAACRFWGRQCQRACSW